MQAHQFTAFIEREDDGFVALCPELDVASQGGTVEEAKANLAEAVELFLETAPASEVESRGTTIAFVPGRRWEWGLKRSVIHPLDRARVFRPGGLCRAPCGASFLPGQEKCIQHIAMCGIGERENPEDRIDAFSLAKREGSPLAPRR